MSEKSKIQLPPFQSFKVQVIFVLLSDLHGSRVQDIHFPISCFH